MGTDPLEVYKVVKEAADRARRGEGPSLVETICYRLTAHSSDDDQRQYRDAEELENEKKFDPIPNFRAYLKETGVLTDELEKEMEERL